MTFQDQMTADVANVFLNTDDFATAMVTSAGATVNGIVNYAADLAGYEMTGQAVFASVEVNVVDFPDPQRYQTLTFGGFTWRIDNIVNGDGYMWRLAIVRDLRAS